MKRGLTPFHLAVLAAGFAFLYVPIALVVLYSFNASRLVTVWGGFSTQWYMSLFANEPLLQAASISFRVALASAAFSTVLGTCAAFALQRFGRFPARTLFTGMLYAPLVMPEVIIGLSLLLLFVGMERLLGWPERGTFTIVLGHALLGMAYASVVIQSRLKEMDRSIEEAALDLGCRPFQVFFLVTLPNMTQALLAAWLLTFTLSFDDVVISEFLAGPGVTTLPQVIFNYARRGVNPSIYAAASLLMLVVSLAVAIYGIHIARQSRKNTLLPAE